MLILPQSYLLPDKNPKWQYDTPNNLFKTNLQYHDGAVRFATEAGFHGPWGFEEIRITNARSDVRLHHAWWEDPLFFEKVFWVYRTPIYLSPDNDKWGVFLLEPYECDRVEEAAITKFGHPVFGDTSPIILPIDVTTKAWEETTGGISDHIRQHLWAEPSDEEKAKEKEERELIESKLKDVQEITQELWEGDKKNEHILRK